MGYQPEWERRQKEILAIAEAVKAAFPAAWAKACAEHDDGEFIRRVAYAVHQDIPECGLNGKRGTDEKSKDVLCFPNKTGVRDAGGTYPGVEIIDIIGQHETARAHLAWIDQTEATRQGGTVGKWIKPQPVGGEKPGEPKPKPCPDPCPDPKAHQPKHYPGDRAFDVVGELLEADYREAGQALNAQSATWFARTIFDYLHGGMTLDASIAKHRAEWRGVLGLGA